MSLVVNRVKHPSRLRGVVIYDITATGTIGLGLRRPEIPIDTHVVAVAKRELNIIVEQERWREEQCRTARFYLRVLACTAGEVARQLDVHLDCLTDEQIESIQLIFAQVCYEIAVKRGEFRLPSMSEPWYIGLLAIAAKEYAKNQPGTNHPEAQRLDTRM